MHSQLFISQADRRPMYLQIVEQIRRRIALGDWPAGQELPSIRALAAASQVSVITVKRAYFELERSGAIVTRQGRGSFVADNAALGMKLHHEEIDAHLDAAADLAHLTGLTAEELGARLIKALSRRNEMD